jgi:hypothetical protein
LIATQFVSGLPKGFHHIIRSGVALFSHAKDTYGATTQKYHLSLKIANAIF